MNDVDYHSVTDFDLGENLVESTYGLDPGDAKSGRVQTQGPAGKRRLWV